MQYETIAFLCHHFVGKFLFFSICAESRASNVGGAFVPKITRITHQSHARTNMYPLENRINYRFRPLWLRSSVVSVLQSLTTLTPWTSTAKLSTLFLERECNVLLAVIRSRVDLLLQYRQELAHSPWGEIIKLRQKKE